MRKWLILSTFVLLVASFAAGCSCCGYQEKQRGGSTLGTITGTLGGDYLTNGAATYLGS